MPIRAKTKTQSGPKNSDVATPSLFVFNTDLPAFIIDIGASGRRSSWGWCSGGWAWSSRTHSGASWPRWRVPRPQYPHRTSVHDLRSRVRRTRPCKILGPKKATHDSNVNHRDRRTVTSTSHTHFYFQDKISYFWFKKQETERRKRYGGLVFVQWQQSRPGIFSSLDYKLRMG